MRASAQNFAIGVLLYELALNTSPWPDYPDECRVAGSHEIRLDASKLQPFGDQYPGCAWAARAARWCRPQARYGELTLLPYLRLLATRRRAAQTGVRLAVAGPESAAAFVRMPE